MVLYTDVLTLLLSHITCFKVSIKLSDNRVEIKQCDIKQYVKKRKFFTHYITVAAILSLKLNIIMWYDGYRYVYVLCVNSDA